jgi:hypothetical protein
MSAAMSPEQVQEVVIQTLRDVMDLGNLAPMPQNFMPEQPMMMPPEQGMPQ